MLRTIYSRRLFHSAAIRADWSSTMQKMTSFWKPSALPTSETVKPADDDYDDLDLPVLGYKKEEWRKIKAQKEWAKSPELHIQRWMPSEVLVSSPDDAIKAVYVSCLSAQGNKDLTFLDSEMGPDIYETSKAAVSSETTTIDDITSYLSGVELKLDFDLRFNLGLRAQQLSGIVLPDTVMTTAQTAYDIAAYYVQLLENPSAPSRHGVDLLPKDTQNTNVEFASISKRAQEYLHELERI
ncbi:hypothetical protein CANCADRAFT_100285 [Tortispora caseinolytica NRRL Y-17796]|uniref:Large ribosomal subunit protein mL50 n=1 Tax=Tortispora caseinolytica NRRL Y-17796 TaxID=767744 RepID=A0A1E4TE98_9ASCO|nr:hypothetical protein CANCADRAFT_100285 [Tortispora caseinolytica NRRL Y-17796]